LHLGFAVSYKVPVDPSTSLTFIKMPLFKKLVSLQISRGRFSTFISTPKQQQLTLADVPGPYPFPIFGTMPYYLPIPGLGITLHYR
jgi:hypothetical protein